MPIHNQLLLLIAIICLLVIYTIELQEFRICAIHRQPYTSKPRITYGELIQNSRVFRKWTNFEIDIFYEYLLQPIV